MEKTSVIILDIQMEKIGDDDVSKEIFIRDFSVMRTLSKEDSYTHRIS